MGREPGAGSDQPDRIPRDLRLGVVVHGTKVRLCLGSVKAII
jgi:hypothetical protein